MANIPQEAHRLLDEPNFAFVATVMSDGSPQNTPVWIDRDGDTVVFNTAKGRAKHRNLQRDPRVAVSVLDRDNPYAYLQVRGRAEFVVEGSEEHIDALQKKYTGHDTYQSRKAGEERITVRVVAEAVDWRPPR